MLSQTIDQQPDLCVDQHVELYCWSTIIYRSCYHFVCFVLAFHDEKLKNCRYSTLIEGLNILLWSSKQRENTETKKQGRIHGTRCAWYAYFSPSKITRDIRTDGLTELRTNGRTDTTSYRDATAHLKSGVEKNGRRNIPRWFGLIRGGF